MDGTAATIGSARDAGLRRGVGPVAFAAAIVNIVIGAGIFTLPAGMAKAAGPYALVAYVLCALAMGAVVLCFAEAGSRVSTSGGIYGYVEAAFGPLAGFVGGVLIWLSCVLAAGGIAAAFAAAVGRLAPGLATPVAQALLIVGVLGTMMLVNLVGVRFASRVIAATTLVKIVPLALFVVVGALFVDPARLTTGAAPDAAGIGRAILISLFAFQGMETSLGASGELADPARTLPRGLVGAMAFVTVFYIAIQIVAQGLLGPALAGSAAPLADGMATIDPRLGLVLVIGTALSMGLWLGSDILGAPRMLFAFARDGFLPRWLGRVDERSGVPRAAILTHAGIAALLALTGTFETLVVLSVLSACALYAAGCAAAWVLRRRGVATAGRPFVLPALGAWVVLGAGSMIWVIALAKWEEIGALAGEIAVSCLIYAVAVRRRDSRAAAPRIRT